MTRRAMRWAARLYPAAWRARYGVEFEALLEDSRGGWAAMADVAMGALTMRMRVSNIWKFVAACGLLGAAIAGVASWRTPAQYVSTAVLRMTPQSVKDGGSGDDTARLNEVEQDVLSRTALVAIIASQDLYKADRARRPIGEIVAEMRGRDIRIRPVKNHPAFTISFAGSTPDQAEQVTNALVAQFIEKNIEVSRRGAPGGGANLEVLDAASAPQRTASPVPSVWIAAGLLLGMLAGAAAVGIRRWPAVAAVGAAGALAAFGIASFLPTEYVSSAVLMGEMQNAQSLLNDGALLTVIQNPALDLYAGERAKMTAAQLAARMRRDLSIRPILRPGPAAPSTHPVVAVSFTYSDPYKARAVTQAVVARIARGGGVMILDPPSVPYQPSRPRPAQWSMAGLAIGLLGGIAVMWMRRRAPVMAPA